MAFELCLSGLNNPTSQVLLSECLQVNRVLEDLAQAGDHHSAASADSSGTEPRHTVTVALLPCSLPAVGTPDKPDHPMVTRNTGFLLSPSTSTPYPAVPLPQTAGI